MAGLSNYLEETMLNSVLRGVAFPAWTTGSHYVGLLTAAPTDAGGGTEVSGGAYARVAVARAAGSWSAPAGTPRATENAAAITFASPTATWGYVGFKGLYDAATAGNLLLSGPIGPNTTLAAGITAAATSLTVASAAGFPATGTFAILIDGEMLNVTAGAGTTTWTVTRGFNGSTAATHASGAVTVQPRLISAGDSAPSFGLGAIDIALD